jgi:hypothetical protein
MMIDVAGLFAGERRLAHAATHARVTHEEAMKVASNAAAAAPDAEALTLLSHGIESVRPLIREKSRRV